ncbi:MAG: NAD(P)H-hydrate dehydratase [Elusimicrobia bacterium]|nr:NAD(P)H-hydrate dehydratase [Elusimicrobiota bacterium]
MSATLRRWLPARRPDSHKGDFGHVLLVAGSRGMAGAALLAARAACRSGAGLVTLGVPEGLQAAVTGHVPEALTVALPETKTGALAVEACGRLLQDASAKKWGVLAIGPGLGQHGDTERALVSILGRLKIPAVIDADGLNLLSRHPRAEVRRLFEERGAPCVLTPHPGEMARLLGKDHDSVTEDREGSARTLAEELACVALLKGRGTIVTDGERKLVNPTGNPGLAKGGTGDVLTGLIAGLWAQRLANDPGDRGYEAAALGAWLHGAAGDAAARLGSQAALTASDVIDALPIAFRRLGR